MFCKQPLTLGVHFCFCKWVPCQQEGQNVTLIIYDNGKKKPTPKVHDYWGSNSFCERVPHQQKGRLQSNMELKLMTSASIQKI